MDFGKWMSSGLPFLDARGEENKRKKLADSLAVKPLEDDGKGMVLTRESDLAFAKRNIDGLVEFLNDDSRVEHVFEDTNAYLRRYLYDTVERRYPQLTMKKNAEGKLCAVKMDSAASLEHRLQVERDALARFEADMGFRLLFKDLVSSKKPIVGHNLFFDILFLLRWIDGPLDANLSLLKTRLEALFPIIFDTKYIASSGILGQEFADYQVSTTLADVYKKFVVDADAASRTEGTTTPVVCCPVSCAEGFPNFLDAEVQKQFHNAGYDAFCTGSVFARQMATLDRQASVGITTPNWRVAANQMLFMMRSLYHMCLNPQAPNGVLKQKGHIFRMTGFPLAVKTEDIVALCSAALDCEASVFEVVWVDDDSLFVVVSSAISADETNEAAATSEQEVILSRLRAATTERQRAIDEAAALSAAKAAEEAAAALVVDGSEEQATTLPAAEKIQRLWSVQTYQEFLDAKRIEDSARLVDDGNHSLAKRQRTL